MTHNRPLAATALLLQASLPDSLLTRTWAHATAAKDWELAAGVAANPGLTGDLRTHVGACENRTVKLAYLARADVDADEVFTLCADEVRPAVLATLRDSDRAGDYRRLLVNAYQQRPSLTTAKLLLEVGDADASVPLAVASDILVRLATAHTTLTRHQAMVAWWWRVGLEGAHASAVIRAEKGRVGTSYTHSCALLCAPGRDHDQVVADTTLWLANNWSTHDGQQLVDAVHNCLRDFARDCGWTPTAALAVDTILDWCGVTAADPAIVARVDELAQIPAGPPLFAFSDSTRQPDHDPGFDASAAVLDEYLTRLDGELRVHHHIEAGAHHLYFEQPLDHDTDKYVDLIARAIDCSDARIARRGWLAAATYGISVQAEAYRCGWRAFGDDPLVRSALLALWGVGHTPVAAFDNTALVSLAWALNDIHDSHVRASSIVSELNRVLAEMVQRQLFVDLPWQPIQRTITNVWDGYIPWPSSPRGAFDQVLTWLAVQVETCTRPPDLWAVVNNCAPTFAGSAGDLLHAAADATGLTIDLGPRCERLPFTVHVD